MIQRARDMLYKSSNDIQKKDYTKDFKKKLEIKKIIGRGIMTA